MRKDIRNYIALYRPCNIAKVPRHKAGAASTLTIGDYPFHTLAVDVFKTGVAPLQRTGKIESANSETVLQFGGLLGNPICKSAHCRANAIRLLIQAHSQRVAVRAELEGYKSAWAKRDEAQGATTARIRQADADREVAAARQLVPELRQQVQELEERLTALAPRVQPAAAAVAPKLISPRNSASPDASLTPRTLEYLRRIVEECNISFKGASTAIALVLGLFVEGGHFYRGWWKAGAELCPHTRV